MKPIKLRLSAFGPYKNLTEIDFTKLGESGIFLITGETGAGKTTIFDAISYALFGEVSGSNRPIESLRSNYSTEKDKTFVELEFEHKNKVYTVRRNPSYMRKSQRGEGMTKEDANAFLVYDDKVFSKIGDVTKQIESILGINARQFKQIGILAQGEFLNILFANSDQRTDIFRRIFDTYIYQLFSQKLSIKANEYKNKIDYLQNAFEINTKNIKWKNEIKDIEQINFKSLNKLDIEDILKTLKMEISERKKEYKIFEENYGKLEKKVNSEKEKIEKLENENKKIREYMCLLEERNILEKEQNLLKENEKIVSNNEEIIKYVIPKKQIYESIKEKYNYNQKEKIQIENRIEKIYETEKDNREKEKNLNKIKDILNEYVKLNDVNVELKSKIEKINKIEDEECKKINLVKEYNKLNKEYEIITHEYIIEEDRFFKEQAGILAEKLEQGKPCPVCGSTEHPHVAEKNENVLSEKELEQLKIKKDNKEKENTKLKNEILTQESKIETLISEFSENKKIELSKYKEKINEEFDINKEKMDNIENEFYKIVSQFNIKEKNIKEFDYEKIKEEYELKIKKDKEDLIKNETLKEQLIKEIEKQEEEKKIAEGDYKNSYIKLGYDTEEKFQKSYLKDSEIDNLKMWIKKYIENVTINNTKINEIEKDINNKKEIDLTEIKENYDIMQEKLANSKNKQIELKTILNLNIGIEKELKSISVQLLKEIDEYLVFDELNKLSNGKLNGKIRIQFEQYVQATYFDMIIIEANKRFKNMTDNRYLLVRKKESNNLKDKLALELEVYDNYNGKKRDVKSLSGGEAFKASLCLALGLSDIIQNYSGGVVIDTLFIDEGFGTLDVESREQAINTLIQLAGSNKLIGIISHVTELKDRIDKKIIIKQTQEGSTVKIESV